MAYTLISFLSPILKRKYEQMFQKQNLSFMQYPHILGYGMLNQLKS